MPLWALATLAGSFAVLLALERWRPLRRRAQPGLRRLAVNLAMAALAALTAALLLRPVLEALAPELEGRGIGLLRLVALPAAAEAAIGVLLLDLSFYLWHRANHRVPLLWRFHAAHHSDPDLDVTTAPRFHAGEIALSVGFRAAQLLAIGPGVALFVGYELAFQLATQLHHANLRLPLGLERALSWVVVTPRMHGVHHGQAFSQTNSNYSVILSVWDRLAGSLHLDVPQRALVIGLRGYPGERGARLGAVLAQPFRRQRREWSDDASTGSGRMEA